MKTLLATAISLLGLNAAEWTVDPAHSRAQFAVKHMMVSTVRGHFGKVSGTLNYDPAKPADATVKVAVDVSSIDTREEKRDAHLKSPDFFDTAKFPTMTFQSKRVVPNTPGKLSLVGDLTIHGVTKEVTFEVEGPAPPVKAQDGVMRSGATATTKINRKDFGLTWTRAIEAGGVVVGDEVSITIDVELIQKSS